MAEDSGPVDNFNEDGEDVVTLGQLKDAIEQNESERVMNGPKSMVCTYPENYVPRQSIFSCVTCQEESEGELAGICFACSENCHAGHEVLQLYTKRNFCCDCGNSKFKNNKCTLFDGKIPKNRRNKYNHNFKGLYCTCDKPYPPAPDDPMFKAEMFQCCICEDWFHGEHIGIPDDVYQDLEQELVCNSCSNQYPWLIVYKAVLDKKLAEVANVTQETSPTTSQEPQPATEKQEPPKEEVQTPEFNGCTLENPEFKSSPNSNGFVFPSIEWRKLLCKCEKCKRMYEDLDIEYLLDENDSALRYVEGNWKAMEDKDGDIFNEIAQTTSHEVALTLKNGVANLSSKLKEFLDKSDPGKVITKEDIENFFDGVNAKKFKPNEDL
ncbi:unnamed protein product [Bursaphelenchus xylophilus]|uniref:(pine wood nematode) hypothetical protein n=1 Tax=Bursaphelenchus xylophilus TaxID=6326 RepID=A0A1I7S1E9_BURXY|nr:unnamed protein product [Bursaphelenchus xylophilus]CAG9081609.1 unnamed protein product [Bursaphelenchus xylophilus]